eukprot:TRINITY_DN11280_c0_g1_i1.p1 TRINITY_DN11280_c0_g1~~TRINITY_DN11280_c0_g1_i1.p1  ORF type:complete len:154 (-),score=26.36 TRINITY_DN11280_c0_g1_i1:96-557(-)
MHGEQHRRELDPSEDCETESDASTALFHELHALPEVLDLFECDDTAADVEVEERGICPICNCDHGRDVPRPRKHKRKQLQALLDAILKITDETERKRSLKNYARKGVYTCKIASRFLNPDDCQSSSGEQEAQAEAEAEAETAPEPVIRTPGRL